MYRKYIVQLHHFITFVGAVMAAELFVSFLRAVAANKTGQQPVLLIVFYIMCNVLRNASARVLILLVSWGYGFK